MSEKKYFPQLDSLRAIACLSVIMFHSATETFLVKNNLHPWFGGGFIGVDLFFVLSGFLITSILVGQYAKSGKINILNFYYKRALRLYPPIIISVIIFLIPMLFIDKGLALSNIFFLVTYTGDIVMIFQKIFPILQYPVMFSHSWSLAVEEQFYLIYPSIFTVIMNFFSKKKKNLLNVFPLFNILFIIIILVASKLLGFWFYKFFVWRFFQIFFGAFIALIYSDNYEKIFSFHKTYLIRNFFINLYKNSFVYIFCWIIFILSVTGYSMPYMMAKYNLHYYFLTIIFSVIITNSVYIKHYWSSKILENKVLVYVGKISYGLYLYHVPIFYLNEYLKLDNYTTIKGAIVHDLINLTLVFILSIISFEFIEKKFLKLKEKKRV